MNNRQAMEMVEKSNLNFVDFALWGPMASRKERLHQYEDWVVETNGSLKSVLRPGPPNLQAWLDSWRVFPRLP